MEMKNGGAGKTLETEEEARRSPEKEESEIDDDEREIEKLEREVNEMATKILEYRTNLPSQLSSTFSSILASSRPVLSDSVSSRSDPGPSALSSSSGEVVISSKAGQLMEEDQKTVEKMGLLKAKMSSNIAAMPVVLKRMRECISNIDKLDSRYGIIHPVFKQNRTS